MDATPNNQQPEESEATQGLQGFMSNEEWDELLAHVSGLIREMEQLPDEQIRTRVFELLQSIDAIHRESLTRLVRLFKEGVLEQVITDPAIHTLMELYDLLPAEPGDQPTGETPKKHHFPDIPIKVVAKESKKASGRPRPHWVPVLQSRDELGAGEVKIVPADDRELLLSRVEDAFFALDPRCPQDGSPLTEAGLSRYTLVCPHHKGCYYDVRSGARVGGGHEIRGYSVRIDDAGRVLIGIGMPFEPKLPAF